MTDVSVEINGIVICSDESLLSLSIGNGYTFQKVYFDELPFKEKVVDGRGNLDIAYMNSRLHDTNGVFFICIKKADNFQIEGLSIPNAKVPIIITDKEMMCTEQLSQYQENEMDYIYKIFAMLRVYKEGNIGIKEIFLDYSYCIIFNNKIHNTSDSVTRNTVDSRMYSILPGEVHSYEQFLADYSGRPFTIMKPAIDVFIWALEQIDVATGFEQYTKALEMMLLESNQQGKKQSLANRVAVLISNTPLVMTQLQAKMLDFYIYRSESLHEGDSSNITSVELREIEQITRQALLKMLECCRIELSVNVGTTWEEIKSNTISKLKADVLIAKSTGVLL